MLQREPEADRRTVTVLFADLAGFTALGRAPGSRERDLHLDAIGPF